MTAINSPSIKKKHDGIVLLVLVITLALTISVYYFSSISLAEIQADKQQQTRVALKQAKKLLLAYAVMRADLKSPMVLTEQLGRFGYLPCPSNNSLAEGISAGNCDSKNENTLGWFPWRSLKTSPLKDGNGDCLLYAVSGDYKVAPRTDMLNEDSNGMFQLVNETGGLLQGNTAPDRVVAIIFSAGDALTGQNRNYQNDSECGNDDDNYSAYLDALEVSPGDVVDNSALVTGNKDEVYRFVQAATETNKSIINDQFITISREELWAAITARPDFKVKMRNLTEALALCLREYAVAAINGKNRLPWPAPMDFGLDDYRADDKYDDNPDATLGHAGRFPIIVNDSNGIIGIAVADDALINTANCDSLALPVDSITVDGEVLPTGGITVDFLATGNNEYLNLWKNWKDHFFYVVSQDYAPAPTVVNVATTCSVPVLPAPETCITVDGTRRAAAVIFAGSSIGQTRTGPVAPGDINTKHLIINYLENGNEGVFPDDTGNGVYVTGDNDIMFCIEEGLGVVPC